MQGDLSMDLDVTQAALLLAANFRGDDFTPASRVPGRECTYWDTRGLDTLAP